MADITQIENITRSICMVRGHRVLLDAEIAALYGVTTKSLLQAVKRNRERFPEDFMLEVSDAEWKFLRSQFVTSNVGRGGRRHRPYAFTEQGVAMLSSVLRSQRAIEVNIQIMRAFVRMRELISSNAELARRFDELEARLDTHDDAINSILAAIRELMAQPAPPSNRPIGFTADIP